MTDPRDVIAAKRDGRAIPEEDLDGFVRAYARGEIPDYQASAFLMAAYIRGMDTAEALALTRAMVASGETVELRGVTRPIVDKHSTGGVADSVTLVFAPLAAALGLAVAKLSGRGLGHTGGTLDKLESIPGLRTELEADAFVRQVEEVGCAVAAQTADLVPADKVLYALRDATATVSSVPLIAASVMSKKLAVPSHLVLLDVKAGSGAFMKTTREATDLAALCAEIGRGWGRAIRAAVTDMSQPLGEAIGNALDVAEAVEILSGARPGRLHDLVVTFATEAVAHFMGAGREEARTRVEGVLDSGQALASFARMVEAQGGDPRVTEDPWAVLPRAPVIRPILADRTGYLAAVEAEELGRASVDLGAGRHRKDDAIDPAAGIVFLPKIGDRLEAGMEIGVVHGRDEDAAGAAAGRVLAALAVSEEPVEAPRLVYGWHGAAP